MTEVDKQELQRLAGIPHLPTDLTYELRLAVSGDLPLTRDDIMHLVNETAPRYQSWGIEAHFQNFAKSLSAIVIAHERARCLRVCREIAEEAQEMEDRNGASSAAACGAAIWGLE